MDNCGFFTPINGVVLTLLTTGTAPLVHLIWEESETILNLTRILDGLKPENSISLDVQNPPNCLEPLKAFSSGDVKGGSNADPHHVFGRPGSYSP